MPSTKSAIAAVALAAVLVLAGCAGTQPGSSATASPTNTVSPADGTAVDDGGTVEFYLSDEKNAISDFESLNVTITKIGLHRTSDAGENETTEVNETETVIVTETPVNATEESETEQEQEQEQEEEREQESDDSWVEYEVNETADLTELQGANATKLDSLEAPNGSYDKVFIYVDGIEATLTTGEQVNVKLPSSKLHVNNAFTVGNGENVSFVFDMTVHEAGNSGKYILKPVVSESGTSEDVEIRDVDEEDDQENEEERDEEEREDNETDAEEEDENTTEAETNLTAQFVGPVELGANATLKVTDDAGPVENATVLADDERVGVTDASGVITVAVPEEAEELEVAVEKGDAEYELEVAVDSPGEQ